MTNPKTESLDSAAGELKPCPFCGATDGRLVQVFTRATDDFAYWSVECLDCGVEVADDESQEAADRAWNRRAIPPMQDQGDEAHTTGQERALRGALEKIAIGEVPGNPDNAHSMYMNARKLAQDTLSALPHQPATDEGEAEWLTKRVSEVVEEDGGCWTACSGCQESVDGHVSSKDYPRSRIFKCQPGSGCWECGGLGVIWQDGEFLASYGEVLSTPTSQPPAAETRLREEAANIGYRICAETRHVTLGDKVAAAIRAIPLTQPEPTAQQALPQARADRRHHPLCGVQYGHRCDYDCARDYTPTAQQGGEEERAAELIRSYFDARQARNDCPECGNEGPWEHCGPCSDRIGPVIARMSNFAINMDMHGEIAEGADKRETVARIISLAKGSPEKGQASIGAWWWDKRHDKATPHHFEGECREEDRKHADLMIPLLRAALSAQQAAGEAVAKPSAVATMLCETFKRWLEMGPEQQPHFPDGIRPWSTGDLKWIVEHLSQPLYTAPQPEAPAEVQQPVAAAWEGELTAEEQAMIDAAWERHKAAAPVTGETAMTDDQIKQMVSRFLSWKLPDNFNPDGGIKFEPIGNPGSQYEYRHQPTGTNLLDAAQAEAMVRHLVAALATPQQGQEVEG